METGMQQFHSSLTVFSKEFTVFLGYHNLELISDLCDWYDCDRRWAYETISRSTEEIVGVWLNLIAGTTPELIQLSLPMESFGSGLTARIIFVYEEAPDKLVTLPTETSAEREIFTYLVRDLEEISMLSGSFRWTTGFVELWDTWCRHASANPPFHGYKFDGYNGRRRVHLMKLAMIIAVSHGENGLVLTEVDLTKAIKWLAEVEVKMGLTFKGVGKSDIAGLMNKATLYINSSVVRSIPLHTFARYFESDIDKPTLDRLLRTLEVARIARVINRPGQESCIERCEQDD